MKPLTPRILIVEDDEDVRRALARILARRGYASLEASTAAEALRVVAEAVADVVVLDLGLPDRDGVATIPELLRVDPGCRIIVVTGRDDARAAVDALRAGASDYLVKPFDVAALEQAIRRALEQTALRREVKEAQGALGERGVVGSSARWNRTLEEIRAVAERPRAPVLISGESGTGKDVAARLLHAWSPRAQGPFVTVNAACLPAQLLESELFGHEVGAFTDARSARQGLFELAHQGTLFLDEIGDLPLQLQPKLLRVLEGHPFRRVGGQRELRTEVRVVAATNRDLAAMVAAGTFREDLYFRLCVLRIEMPSLRERAGDVRVLVAHFLAALGREMGFGPPEMRPSALERLERYSWPGNVRELRNVVERALVVARGGPIDVQHLPPELDVPAPAPPPSSGPRPAARAPGAEAQPGAAPRAEERRGAPPAEADASLEGAIRRHVLAVYEANAGNVTRTARALGITRVSLRRHLRKYLEGQELALERD